MFVTLWPNGRSPSQSYSQDSKCYPYKRYNLIYVKNILLPYKNTIGKIRDCYVLSVITCSTPFFVNCTSISVNFEKNKVIIYESIHFEHVITFIPYSLRTSQKFSLIQRSFFLVHFQAIWERRWQTQKVWELGASLLVGAYGT